MILDIKLYSECYQGWRFLFWHLIVDLWECCRFFYKLFMYILYNRISSDLFVSQSYDQYIFMSSVRLKDILLIIENMIEYSLEFNISVWLTNTDVCKAFDTIEDESLFSAAHDVAREYISLLHQLHIGKKWFNWREMYSTYIEEWSRMVYWRSSFWIIYWILSSIDGNRDSRQNKYWLIHLKSDWPIFVVQLISFSMDNLWLSYSIWIIDWRIWMSRFNIEYYKDQDLAYWIQWWWLGPRFYGYIQEFVKILSSVKFCRYLDRWFYMEIVSRIDIEFQYRK